MIYLQNRNRFIDVADKLTKGKQVGDKLEVWDQHIHTTIYKIDSKDLLYSIGNYIQYLVICNGKNLNDNIYIYIYICIAESYIYNVVHLKPTQNYRLVILQLKNKERNIKMKT